LEDLHSAESKGKWWLVGAAWGGNPLLDRREALLQKQDSVVGDINDNALVKLARKQGMNTDVRRRIFVALMSSDVRPFPIHALSWLTSPFRIMSMLVNDYHS
jgi:nucleolar MIF4G domain-containing protein 1